MGITQQSAAARLVQPGVCTSTTRPASPFEGQAIFETDTDRMLIWNGTTWVIPNKTTTNPDGLELIGQFTATSGTTLTMDNIFTSTYTTYRIVIESFQVAASVTGLTCQLRAGGSTLGSSGYYGIRVGYAYNTNTAGSANQNNSGSWDMPIISDSGTGFAGAVLEFFNPQVATRTSYTGSGTDTRTTGYGALIGSGFYNANTQCDGIYLSQAQTITSLKAYVYGYRK